jgi:hypothetical protein
MYFHNLIGTGSYTTSTTNMYHKDSTYQTSVAPTRQSGKGASTKTEKPFHAVKDAAVHGHTKVFLFAVAVFLFQPVPDGRHHETQHKRKRQPTTDGSGLQCFQDVFRRGVFGAGTPQHQPRSHQA